MPEAPEVKLLIESISSHIIGRQILAVQIISGKYLAKQKIVNWELLQSSLPLKIIDIGTHGKFIYFRLDKDLAIGIGLGMVGTFQFTLNEKHNRLRLILDNGLTLYYDDYRNFGNWKVFTSWQQLDAKISELGLDLLSEYPLDPLEIKRIHSQYNRQNICKVLMNQELFSGIGNYIKTEALYHEKIHPLVNVGDLTTEQFTKLIFAAKKFARESYDYQKIESIGYRGPERKNLFSIYGKTTDPNGHLVVKIHTPDNRTTSYVPAVQILPVSYSDNDLILEVNDEILE